MSDLPPRVLIQFPTWDGKLVLAGMFLVGYYITLLVVGRFPTPEANAALVHDGFVVLGPVVGLIFGALFRTTGAEERGRALASSDLQAAITAPPAPLALPTPSTELGDKVQAGAREGARQGTHEGMTDAVTGAAALGADGIHRDWLDPPAEEPDKPAGDTDPWPTSS